jgi:hypothetical protein
MYSKYRLDASEKGTAGLHPRRSFSFMLEYLFPFQSAAHRRRLKTGGNWPSDHLEYFSQREQQK